MKAYEKASELVGHFQWNIGIREHDKAKNCAIFLCHSIIWETLDLEKIKFYKNVIVEIEKL